MDWLPAGLHVSEGRLAEAIDAALAGLVRRGVPLRGVLPRHRPGPRRARRAPPPGAQLRRGVPLARGAGRLRRPRLHPLPRLPAPVAQHLRGRLRVGRDRRAHQLRHVRRDRAPGLRARAHRRRGRPRVLRLHADARRHRAGHAGLVQGSRGRAARGGARRERRDRRGGRRHRAADQELRQAAQPRRRRPGPGGPHRRGVRLPRPQRRRQDDHHPRAAGPDPADGGARPRPRPGQPPRDAGDPGAQRLPARRAEPLPQPHRARDAALPRQPARRRGLGLRRRAHGAPGLRPRAQGRRPLHRQPAQDRPHPGVHAPARAADPRRAHLGPRPARPARVLPPAGRGPRRRPDRVPLLARAARGAARVRPRRLRARGPAGRRGGRRRAHGAGRARDRGRVRGTGRAVRRSRTSPASRGCSWTARTRPRCVSP